MSDKLSQRRQVYSHLSSRLAELDNTQLSAMLNAASSPAGSNWGSHETLRLGATKVFVKRIPVTDREVANPYTTRNLYDLPCHYNYGVGSVGLGVYRELLAHIKTNNWVLAGDSESFPLLYAHRIVPIQASGRAIDLADHRAMVTYWGEHPGIDSYLLERSRASHELLLFLEYIPQTLRAWLFAHPDQVERMLASLRDTLDFLSAQGIIHFDTHFLNVLTDGEQCYLSDFGLALDKRFALAAHEKAFFKHNRDYDYGQVLWSLCYVLRDAFDAATPRVQSRLQARYGLDATKHARQAIPILLDQIEDVHAQGLLKLNDTYVACLLRYRDVIQLMQAFYTELQANQQKDTRFRHAQLRRCLLACGFR